MTCVNDKRDNYTMEKYAALSETGQVYISHIIDGMLLAQQAATPPPATPPPKEEPPC